MLIRAKFQRLKPVRYISHLELMTAFRRAFRRAGLPVAFSEGYNPHIKLSLCQPLSVGMIGRGEYLDLELDKDINVDKFIKFTNCKLPSGIKILNAREIKGKVKSLMAVINTAVYDIDFNLNDLGLEKQIEEAENFLNLNEIKITRHRRKKEDRIIDLRPMIYDLKVMENGKWRFTVSTGSRGNVRYSELVRAVASKIESIDIVPVVNIERHEMYVLKSNKYYQPYFEEIVGG